MREMPEGAFGPASEPQLPPSRKDPAYCTTVSTSSNLHKSWTASIAIWDSYMHIWDMCLKNTKLIS
jgi:hypothetical protein